MAFVFTYGRMVGDRRQGQALFLAMGVLLVAAFAALYLPSARAIRCTPPLPTRRWATWRGKEVRFGVVGSALWAVATTAASNGSVNAMHDSLTPLGGLIAMLQMQLGEVIFGGVGVGLTGLLLFVILTVFLAGLMVGRTPEYLGKKIEAARDQARRVDASHHADRRARLPAIAVWAGTAQSSVQDAGPHGLSELIYAYSSATGNNGSAFAGFTANTPFHNVKLGLAMLLGRFGTSSRFSPSQARWPEDAGRPDRRHLSRRMAPSSSSCSSRPS